MNLISKFIGKLTWKTHASRRAVTKLKEFFFERIIPKLLAQALSGSPLGKFLWIVRNRFPRLAQLVLKKIQPSVAPVSDIVSTSEPSNGIQLDARGLEILAKLLDSGGKP